ncbi:hypothetical protein [uncultured Algibacter sp.]|uniref:hypothetical protein n=1 Tax=uncultured Algibacter sp. TaxID=298659 RepID=UPI002621A163|nr:hypothetical protein [uncultured Algibacter sp.]
MILIYLLIGFLTATISALPLGASNIAVINTTLKQNAQQAFKIAITAGIAEVILSYYTLHFNKVIKDFFNNNLWVQVLLVVILFVAGSILLLKKQSSATSKKRIVTKSKYATGFLLGMINPPVLIYWVIAYGVINSNDFMLSLKSSFSTLFLFFSGVYLGKLLTLYAYSKVSLVIKSKIQNINKIVNKVTGLLLIFLSFIQALKIYVF